MLRSLISSLPCGVRSTLRPSLISIYTHASVPFGTKNINRRESPWAHLSASDHLQVPLMIKGIPTWSQNWRLGDEALWVRSFDGASRLVQRKSCIHKKILLFFIIIFSYFLCFSCCASHAGEVSFGWELFVITAPAKRKKRATKRVQVSRLGGENYSRSSGAIKQVCVFEDYFWMKMFCDSWLQYTK